MALTLSDAYISAASLAMGYGLYLEKVGKPIAFVNAHPRWSAFILLMVGLAMCAMGGKNVAFDNTYMKVMAVVGGLALLIGILGVITGSKIYMYIIAIMIIAMWLVTTIRHAQ
jgi:hypothetical protein